VPRIDLRGAAAARSEVRGASDRPSRSVVIWRGCAGTGLAMARAMDRQIERAVDDLVEARRLLERQRMQADAAAREAAARRRLAESHPGRPGDPRLQGLLDAAAHHAARARAARARLEELKHLAEGIRARAAAGREEAARATAGGA